MERDALDELLSRQGIYKRLREREPTITRAVLLLFASYRAYHRKTIANIEILQKLVWDVIRVDPVILSFLVENADKFDLREESENYGGPVSKRITYRALQFAEEKGLLKEIGVNQY